MLEATIIVVAMTGFGLIVNHFGENSYTIRWGIVIFFVGLLGMFFVLGLSVANAQSVQTTVTVEIVDEISSASVTASVPCNEINCPQEEVEVGFFTRVANWFSNLWTGQN